MQAIIQYSVTTIERMDDQTATSLGVSPQTPTEDVPSSAVLLRTLILILFLAPVASTSEKPQREKINLPGFEQGDLFVLSRKSNDQLVKYERSEWVCVAILIREGLELSHRQAAIAELARIRKTDEVPQILDGITRAAHNPGGQTGALDDLVELLVQAPRNELKESRETLIQLATDTEHPRARRAGFAGLILADGAVDPGWELAEKTAEGLVDLLGAAPLISDPTLLDTIYPKVEPLAQTAPSRDVRRAAILALGSLSGHASEAYALLAGFIHAGTEYDTAIAALLRLPTEHWPTEQLQDLVDSVIRHLQGVDPTHRNTPEFQRARQLGEKLASLLPETRGEQVRMALESLTIRIVTIRAVPHLMRYDKVHLVVQAGQPVQITLENPDAHAHNLVIVVPGALAEVGVVASQMLEDSDKFQGKAYVPNSDKVLLASQMVRGGQSDAMTFVAPESIGTYPYLCTFPGHWVSMNGTLHVVEDVDAWIAANPVKATGADPDARKFVRAWKVDDLAGDLNNLATGRRLDRGKELFSAISCKACHEVGQVSRLIGPGLGEVTGRLKPVEMLAAILMPSHSISEKYRTWVIQVDDGRALTGIITQQDDQAIHLVQNPLANADPIRISREQIEATQQSDISTMPMGLLNTLTKDEILDLLAYIRSGDSS